MGADDGLLLERDQEPEQIQRHLQTTTPHARA
jgi:hypothetical protein